MSPASRVVLVTGASSGIGRAVALGAAECGHHVVLAARDRGALEDVAGRCAHAASTLVVPTDVGDDQTVRDCVDRVVSTYGSLEAVIHCAAVLAYGRIEDIPVDVFDGVVRTTLVGSVNVARHCIPLMREHGHGTFVQIGSLVAHSAVPLMTPYVISKWAVRALVRQLQVENRDRPGVRICYVSPGAVDTPIYRAAANYSGFATRPPLPTSTPEAVADVALRQLDAPRPRTHVGPVTRALRFGFTVTPRLFDVAVGPLFRLTGIDVTRPHVRTSGNVLDPSPDRYRTREGYSPVAVSAGRNLVRRVRRTTTGGQE